MGQLPGGLRRCDFLDQLGRRGVPTMSAPECCAITGYTLVLVVKQLFQPFLVPCTWCFARPTHHVSVVVCSSSTTCATEHLVLSKHPSQLLH
jgi:hypothetical protein